MHVRHGRNTGACVCGLYQADVLEVELPLVLRRWYDVQSSSLSTICDKVSFQNLQSFSTAFGVHDSLPYRLTDQTKAANSLGFTSLRRDLSLHRGMSDCMILLTIPKQVQISSLLAPGSPSCKDGAKVLETLHFLQSTLRLSS